MRLDPFLAFAPEIVSEPRPPFILVAHFFILHFMTPKKQEKLVEIALFSPYNPTMRRLLASLILTAIPALSQLDITANQEPQVVLDGLHLPKSLATYKIMVCNNGPSAVSEPAERILMAVPNVQWIDQNQAMGILLAAQRKTFPAEAAQGIGVALDLAGMFGGTSTFFTISSRGLSKLAFGSLLARYAENKLAAAIPGLPTNVLGSTLSLGPAPACGTYTFFASRVKVPKGGVAPNYHVNVR
jgi:hypothetical protein